MRFKELLFTGFYSGYVPFAPGTAGSLAGMLLYIIVCHLIGGSLNWIFYIAGLAALFYPSVLICDAGEMFFGRKDPGPVVWDEIYGYWVTMLFVPYSWKAAIAGFVLFRLMDIIKPFPAYRLQNLKGGLGILIDDVAAGVYACIIMHIIIYAFKAARIDIL